MPVIQERSERPGKGRGLVALVLLPLLSLLILLAVAPVCGWRGQLGRMAFGADVLQADDHSVHQGLNWHWLGDDSTMVVRLGNWAWALGWDETQEARL